MHMKCNLYQLPHCPACGSVDANKIGTGTKVAKTAAFGVVGAMSDARNVDIMNYHTFGII